MDQCFTQPYKQLLPKRIEDIERDLSDWTEALKKPHLCNPNLHIMKKFLLFTVLTTCTLFVHAQVELIVKKDEKGLYLEHVVAAKEGLYAIGRLYNVSPKHIASYNKIDINHGINIDQVLRIPLTDTNFLQKGTSGTPVYYQVVAGDGLLKVSNENNKVALKNLRDWNNLPNDNIQADTKLVIGFLNSKEMTAQRANNLVKKTEVAATKPPQQTPPVETRTEPKTEPVAVTKQESTTEKKSDVPAQTVPAVVREEVKPTAQEIGYFKAYFEQQVKSKPASKNATVTSGIFKTSSGWQDAKYYMLIDNVSPGTIVKVVNPGNNRTVYAKVLGEMNGIRQNQGLDIRISNAAASALQINEDDKFIVKVNY
jgi:LysM repeat protein